MFAKRICILVFLLFAAVIIGSISLPALAAGQGQEDNPTERLRPDQYAYHGNEELPFLPSSHIPMVEPAAMTSPVEQWSKMVFETYIDGNWDIYYASGSFTDLVRLTHSPNASDIHPRLNRGCNRIVFASDRAGDFYDIFTINVDGTSLVQLTSNEVDDVKPAWSPDGTRIAFQTYRDGNAEVYAMNADGSGQTNLSNSPDYDGEPFWSPDGSKIAFTSRRSGGYRIWVMAADGSNPVMLSLQNYSENPVWSPDGSQIAYDADNDGDDGQEVWSMNADGSAQTMRVEGYTGITNWANGWSPDGAWLTYTNISLIYYEGVWYWNYAWLLKISQDGYTDQVNQGRTEDWDLDWTTTDIQPPTTSMNTPESPVAYDFSVSWSGQDSGAGIASYDVQIREGSSGLWTNWQIDTTLTSADYIGVGGHSYYFRVQARDNAFNTQAWPVNYQAVATVESAPPITYIDPIESLIRGDQVTLNWRGFDVGGSGIDTYTIQYKDSSIGAWENWLTEGVDTTTAIFTGAPGHTYHFRIRGTDRAQNVAAWPPGDGDKVTTYFSWLTTGLAHDNTGAPVSGMNISIDPQAFLTLPSDVKGKYSAYLASDPITKTISWSNPGYGTLPPTVYGLPDANVDVTLPPANNLVGDPGFENGDLSSAWLAGGDITPTLTNTMYHSGGYALSMGVMPALGEGMFFSNIVPQYSPDSPVLFPDQVGGLHVAWIEGGYSNPHKFYYAQRFPNGEWLDPEQVFVDNTADEKIGVVVDENLNVHMLIQSDIQILYTVRDAGGHWTTPQMVFQNRLFGMKIDNSSTIHAIYRDEHGVTFYARHEPDGTWETQPLPGSAGLLSPTIAINPQGVVNITWMSDVSSYAYTMLRKTDGTWIGPVLISRPAAGIWQISSVVDSAGVAHIVLLEASQLHQLSYIALKPDGTRTTPYIFAESGMYPKLMIDREDTVYAIWADDTGSQEILFAEKPAHGKWTFPQNISHSPERSVSVDGAVSAGGEVYVTWQEIDNSSVYYAMRHAGTWSDPVRLSGGQISALYARVAFDAMDGVNIGMLQGYPNDGLMYFRTQPLTQSGISSISQSLTIPDEMPSPRLSFLASLSGISAVSGNEFNVLVSTGTSTTTLVTSTSPATWGHYWFDLSPWSGEAITLTFQVSENAGFPPANAILDEITLGTAYPDVWVNLNTDTGNVHLGDQFDFHLDYGNHAGAVAYSSIITLTLPAELNFVSATRSPAITDGKLVWQVGDLLASTSFSDISLTVEVGQADSTPRTLVTNVEISTSSSELELMNNTFQYGIYLGYKDILPLIWK